MVKGVMSFNVDVPATIRLRLLKRGWKLDGRGHLYMLSENIRGRKVRVVLKARVAYVDVPSSMPNSRGRHQRIVTARAFYSTVVFFEDGGVRIGGTLL